MSKSEVLRSQMELSFEGRARAKWLGAKDAKTISDLFEFYRTQGWRGQWRINFSGNGGVSEIIFDEIRPASLEKT